MPLSPGARFGPYEVLSPLGTGGMGEVYRAHDPKLERDVALKILRLGPGSAASAGELLLREARAASLLNHPNIATIYEAGESRTDGEAVPYIAMELVDGPTLREWAGPGQRGAGEVLEIAIQIAGALAFAHARGVVHRDVKPSNIVLSKVGIEKRSSSSRRSSASCAGSTMRSRTVRSSSLTPGSGARSFGAE